MPCFVSATGAFILFAEANSTFGFSGFSFISKQPSSKMQVMTYQPPFALDLYATMLHAGEKGISKGFDAIDAANLFAKIKVADLLQIRTGPEYLRQRKWEKVIY